MSLIEKVFGMLGFHTKAKAKDVSCYVGPDVARAVQRNEAAGDRARRALEELKMSDTVRDIVGKM